MSTKKHQGALPPDHSTTNLKYRLNLTRLFYALSESATKYFAMCPCFYTIYKSRVTIPALLVLAGFASHLQWFNPWSTLNFADWYYWNDTAIRELWYSWGTWVNLFNSGAPNIQVQFVVLTSIWSLLAHIGLTYDQAVKITFLIPIAIMGFLSPYILFKRLFKINFAALSAALFYGSTTYFLVQQTSHIPIAFVYTLAPLILLSFMNALENSTIKSWGVFASVYTIGLIYEVRIMLLVSLVIGLYYLVEWLTLKHKRIWQVAFIGILLIAFSMFWILPALFNASAISSVASRGLFGSFLFSLSHAVALSESSWTGGAPDQNFNVQPIPWFLWVWPILAFSSLLLVKYFNNAERRLVGFFMFVALLGIFLTKQSAAPFSTCYLWLYDNFPGFSLFREASKFYFFTAIGYAGLICLFILGIDRLLDTHKAKKIFTSLLWLVVMLLAFMNLKPLIFDQFGTMFTPRHIPQDYVILDKFIGNQPEFFRTLWLPTYSRWNSFSSTHPEISTANEITGEWSELIDPRSHTSDWPIQSQMTDLITKTSSQKILSDASIKYLVIPTRDKANDDDFFTAYGNDREYFVAALDKVAWLKRVNIGTQELAVYENKNYQVHVSSSNHPISIDTMSYADKAYSFLETIGQGTSKLIQSSTNTASIQRLKSLFEAPKIHPSTGSSATLTETYQAPADTTANLYKNASATSIGYSTTKTDVTIFTKGKANPFFNNALLSFPKSNNEQTLLSSSLKGSTKYLMLDDQLIPITPETTKFFGNTKQYSRAGVYQLGKNLLPNSSFERGLWQPQVEDCNNYDSSGQVNMSLNATEHTDGKYALQLEAVRHNACTHTNFSVHGQTQAILKFDYQTMSAKPAGYYLAFDDPAKTTIQDNPPIDSGGWHNLVKDVHIPAGATKATLYFYAYESDGHSNNLVRYDNITFNEKQLVAPITLPKASDTFTSVPIHLVKGDNSITYTSDKYDGHNLVPNPFFDNGPWQPRVEDCNNYDHNPKISQSIDTQNHLNSSQSLRLEATRHTACTSTSFTLEAPGEQLFSLDYQTANTKQGGYYISFNDQNRTIINGPLPSANNNWQHFEKKIIAPIGATSATLNLYAYESDGITTNVMRYGNIWFSKIADLDNVFYVVTDPTRTLSAPKKIIYTAVNPTKYSVQLSNMKEPFMLNFSEGFHPDWKLYLQPLSQQQPGCTKTASYIASMTIPSDILECKNTPHFIEKNDIAIMQSQPVFDDQHIKLNGYVNGWMVDPDYVRAHFNKDYYRENTDGSIDVNLIIYFKPQSSFYIGLVITGVTLGAGVVTGLVLIIRQRWRYHHRIRFKSPS